MPQWKQHSILFLPFFVCLFVCLFFCTKFWSLYLEKATYNSRRNGTTHSYQCVQYFCVSEQWYGCLCLRFLTCAQMLMHAIAHGGCMKTIRESAMTEDCGIKIPCCKGKLNLGQYRTWLFSLTHPAIWAIRPKKLEVTVKWERSPNFLLLSRTFKDK